MGNPGFAGSRPPNLPRFAGLELHIGTTRPDEIGDRATSKPPPPPTWHPGGTCKIHFLLKGLGPCQVPCRQRTVHGLCGGLPKSFGPNLPPTRVRLH